MPVIAQYNLEDTVPTAVDSAVGNGAQNGLYLNGAASAGGQAVLDGVDDFVKIYPNGVFQMDRGTLDLTFTRGTEAMTGPETVLSRDSVGETAGGYRVDVLPDGSVRVSHESPATTLVWTTPAGFSNPGDTIRLSYSWDQGGAGGQLVLTNDTTPGTFTAEVPNTVTMDQGGINQPWIIGAGQSTSDPDMLNNIDQHFQGQVGFFQLSDDVAPPEDDRDGIVWGTGNGDLIDGGYLGDNDGDRVDANDALLPGEVGNDDIIRAGAGNDTVIAGEGHDDVTGGTGDDSINGGDGNDSVQGEDGNDSIYGDLGDDTLNGGAGNDEIVGGGGNDSVTGGAGNDELQGNEGDDVVTGGLGNDTARGGAGNDLIRTGDEGSPDRTYPGLYVADTDPNDDRDSVIASFGDDTIYTGDDADTITAGDGNDMVYAGVDDDDVLAGQGNDLVVAGEGNDTVNGDDGNDVIYGGLGEGAADSINLPDATDQDANNNRDSLTGGAGDDTVYGLDDDDTLNGDAGNDLLSGGLDDDWAAGGDGNDTVNGDEGNDTLSGDAGNDVLGGGDGNDSVLGGAGNDAITGGAGADTLTGGADRDVFTGANAGDSVDGSETGDDFDTLDLRGLGPLSIVYDPTNAENGVVTFRDAAGAPTGTMSFVNIENVLTDGPTNGDPVANPDTASTTEGTPVTIPVLANDTDPDGNPISIVGTPTSPNGTVTVNPNGTITFDPTDGFTGPTTITYVISDGNGGTDTGTVTVTVTPDTDPTRDGIVRGTGNADLIDRTYVDPTDGDRVDANDQILPGADINDDVILAGDGNDTVWAGNGDDSAEGGLGDDSITGNAGNDTLLGQEGNDFIHGGRGNDSITGGIGNDTARGGNGDDVIDTSGNPLALPDIDYPGIYNADLAPNDDRDLVYGGRGNDVIRTGDDADTIYGGYGNDRIEAGIDADSVAAGLGNDTVVGGEGADTINAGQGDDLVYGGYGPDVPEIVNIPDDNGDLRPNNNRDLIEGGMGNDTIFGMDDDDTLLGGVGNDVLDGGVDDDSVRGGMGNDEVRGGQGNDELHGDRGNDSLIGGSGTDTMSGEADRDDFIISSQNDGIGDTVYGGAGGDDWDRLLLAGSGPFRLTNLVTDSDGNGRDGTVEFLDTLGNVTGRLNFTNIEEIVPCFTPGTLIATPKGEVPVEMLREGDRVLTRDNGIQEIRWAGRKDLTWRDLHLAAHLKPVLIRAGSLGNGLPERDMMLSPNHRVLVANDRTALYFDEHEVLVSAKHLARASDEGAVYTDGVSYLHLMFDRHEVLLSNGAWTESFQPGDYSLKGLGNAQRNEILEIFPELQTAEGLDNYQAARRVLKKHEASLLLR